MSDSYTFYSKITGSTHVNNAQALISELEIGDKLILEPQQNNPYDKHAIAVHNPEYELIGYIPATTAAKIRDDVEYDNVTCRVASITGGTPEKEYYGCNIEITVFNEFDSDEEEEEDEDNILISVVNMFDSISLLELLKNNGFNVEIYEADQEPLSKHSEQECIWVGSNIPPTIAVFAIKLAVSIWPHLKYIHLSNDGEEGPPDYVHNQLFFGGSTKTAKEYGIREWSIDEIAELDESMDLERFHLAIRQKYS